MSPKINSETYVISVQSALKLVQFTVEFNISSFMLIIKWLQQ